MLSCILVTAKLRQPRDMPARPIVVCDILGTLFPLTPIGPFIQSLISHQLTSTTPPHSATVLPSPILLADLLYAELLKDSASLTLAHHYTPIATLLPRLVERVVSKFLHKHCGGGAGVSGGSGFDAAYRLSEAETKQLQAIVATLPPRQHARDFIRRVSAAGCTLVALSNGSVSTTNNLLQHAGFDKAFAAVLSAEQVKAAKPDVRVYELVEAGGYSGSSDGGMVFVSVHSWDCIGVLAYNRVQQQTASTGSGKAHQTYTVCYVSEEERRWLLEDGDRPAIVASDLQHAATQIEQLAGMTSTAAGS